MSNISRVMLGLVFLLLFLRISYSAGQVIVEFFYWDPSTDPRYCDTCPPWIASYNDFLTKNQTIQRIHDRGWDDKVAFEWIDLTSAPGDVLQLYNITSRRNSVLVINGTLKIEGDLNETYIVKAIEAILEEIAPPDQPSEPLISLLALAFSFGFLETFSPCLIALLSFTMSYTIGKTTRFREGFSQVMTFGMGFTIAALSLGLAVAVVFSSFLEFQIILTWIISFIAIFFGLNLLGLFGKIFDTQPLVKKLAREYVFTYSGLLLLGFLFYFLDPCIAPVFIAMLPILSSEALPLIILVFSIGVILPFFFIGLLAGSISKLARETYRHKPKIRAISGLILIAYAIYLIIFYLL
ncbi:MAG: hypothetical protein JSV51_03500 [Candidatus Bathyarchaeota archaeon]|nr:MAG: hypothetical protein JSV51_03500 [Candidatus Bathyarchaeota archaeon]